MVVEVTNLEPVADQGGLLFTANVRIGPVTTLGWRGTRDRAGGLRIGPPVRTYFEGGGKYIVPVIQLAPALMEEAFAAIRAAWESRERGKTGGDNGGQQGSGPRR